MLNRSVKWVKVCGRGAPAVNEAVGRFAVSPEHQTILSLGQGGCRQPLGDPVDDFDWVALLVDCLGVPRPPPRIYDYADVSYLLLKVSRP